MMITADMMRASTPTNAPAIDATDRGLADMRVDGVAATMAVVEGAVMDVPTNEVVCSEFAKTLRVASVSDEVAADSTVVVVGPKYIK